MFGLGLSEIILVIIVLIIIINPKDYPIIIRKVSKSYQQLLEFKKVVTRELNMLDIDEIKDNEKKNKKLYNITNTKGEPND